MKQIRLNQLLPRVTRVEVIDHTGRAYVMWNNRLRVHLSDQDDGRTLKVFVAGGNENDARVVSKHEEPK